MTTESKQLEEVRGFAGGTTGLRMRSHHQRMRTDAEVSHGRTLAAPTLAIDLESLPVLGFF